MDGLFHGKPYFLMDDLGGSFPIISGGTPIWVCLRFSQKSISLNGSLDYGL